MRTYIITKENEAEMEEALKTTTEGVIILYKNATLTLPSFQTGDIILHENTHLNAPNFKKGDVILYKNATLTAPNFQTGNRIFYDNTRNQTEGEPHPNNTTTRAKTTYRKILANELNKVLEPIRKRENNILTAKEINHMMPDFSPTQIGIAISELESQGKIRRVNKKNTIEVLK